MGGGGYQAGAGRGSAGLRRLVAGPGDIGEKLGLISSLSDCCRQGREDIPWSMMAMMLVLMRLCEPSSELRIAEHLYERSTLGGPAGRYRRSKVNDDRLYRALDSAAAAQGGAGEASQRSAWGAVRPGVRPAAVRRDHHLLRGSSATPTSRPSAATRATTVRTASRCASPWW